MSQPTFYMEETRCSPIYENTKGGRGETTHDPIYEEMGETNMSEKELKVGTIHIVICFR